MSVAQSNDNNYYFAGVGPWQSGTLKTEIHRTTTGEAAVRRIRLPPNVVLNRVGPKRLALRPGLRRRRPRCSRRGPRRGRTKP